jgi:hypothetical protein
MTNIFAPNSGYIKPSELKTGDLLFPWNPGSKPVFFSKLNKKNTKILNEKTTIDDEEIESFLSLSDIFNTRLDKFTHLCSGHVAMIIVENNIPYVIEAGATDYCNYRVTIHPYYIEAENELGFQVNQMRGWLNRRIAEHEKIWHVRSKSQLSTNQLQKITDYSKSLLGRPFGVMDSLFYSDVSRIYCSEFIYLCYKKIDVIIDDQRTWSWLLRSPTMSYSPLNFKPKNSRLFSFIFLPAFEIAMYGFGFSRPPFFCVPALFHSKKFKLLNTVIINELIINYGVEDVFTGSFLETNC